MYIKIKNILNICIVCDIVLFVIFAWAGTSLIIKLTLTEEEQTEAGQYNKPLFIGYISCSSFLIYSFKFLYDVILKYKCRIRDIEDKDVRMLELKTALINYPIFFSSVTLYYHWLSRTTLSSTIILGNTSSVFVFIFSLWILKEKFSFIKLFAMIFWAGGIATIAYSDSDSSSGTEHILGDIFGVIAAILLGLYSTLLARLIPVEFEETVSFFNILGFLGTFWFITFWPLLLIFHFTGIETMQLPEGKAIVSIVENIIFGTLLFDYWWARATILLGPLLANTSVIFVVPLSLILDNFFQKVNFTWMYYAGTVGIVVGFLMVVITNYNASIISNSDKIEELESKCMNDSNWKSQSLVSD